MILGKEPAIIIGALVAVVAGAIALIQGHGLDDGLQLDEALTVAAPLAAAFGIRFKTWAQYTVDLLAPRDAQRRAIEQRKGR
jgi:hypothetical protein